MMKVNEMVIRASEMKCDWYDIHSHLFDMAFANMRMKMNLRGNSIRFPGPNTMSCRAFEWILVLPASRNQLLGLNGVDHEKSGLDE